jgi:hypothetical protein
MLLKLGQGRAVSKGLLNLACVFVLGSHGHHLRASNVSTNAARLICGRVESHIGCRIMGLAARFGKAGRPLSLTGFLIVSLPAG